ncbi:MAG: HNH endonuclease [Paracoccaceae bacterium]|nr:HNH endonuclease [Paracoccaceae bacterium]
MTRREFSKQTKRDALKRADRLCEASGPRYGLPESQRCNAPLAYGVEFDHWCPDWFSKDNELENCAAVCPTCHKVATKKDQKDIAKAKRIDDKHLGIKKPTTWRGWRKMNGEPVWNNRR